VIAAVFAALYQRRRARRARWLCQNVFFQKQRRDRAQHLFFTYQRHIIDKAFYPAHVRLPASASPIRRRWCRTPRSDLSESLHVHLSASHSVAPGGQLTYALSVQNGSSHGLNGTQAVFDIPSGVTFVASPDGGATQVGSQIVVTIGRLDTGGNSVARIQTRVNAEAGSKLRASAMLRSSTALSVPANTVHTSVGEESESH
jgi:uncharacterized repeat protein (TIGR01451 family)